MDSVDTGAREQRRWLKRFGRPESEAVQLLCFHHAGGSAWMFREWADQLPPVADPVAVQLPGRVDRMHESPYEDMDLLVAKIIDVAKPYLDQPYACYGASMGGRVAWAFCHALAERGMPLPRRLYVASNPAPTLEYLDRTWEEPDSGLITYMREMGGTPPEILAEPEFVRRLLPTLRADLTLLGRHSSFRPATPLPVDLTAFAGADDLDASPERMRDWALETSARFDLDIIPGGHFVYRDGFRHMMEVIRRDLGPGEHGPPPG